METIIKGGNLMVFVGYTSGQQTKAIKSIPLATSHTLRISSDTQDVSNKDVAGGKWSANEVAQLSWEATTDNLYCVNGYDFLFDLMTNQELVDITFAPKSEADGTELPQTGSWTPTAGSAYIGKAYITSLEVTAQNGENATLSATFTGYGELSSTSITPGQ